MQPSGILPLHKPVGMTSHDCVMKVRKLFQTKKVGHTGTLDPDVNGVLPICIGKATKVAQYMSDYPKTYEGEVTIGYSTTTEDKSGEVVERKAVITGWKENEIEELMESFVGEIEQIPPMYSAVKVNGKRLYEYARAGKEVERPKRRISIYSLTLLGPIQKHEKTVSFRFRVHCSKGTYVRTLAVDLGKKLGFPAHMSDLTRVKSGPFSLDECIHLEELAEMEIGQRGNQLLPLELAIAHIPTCIVDKETEAQIKNGSVLPQDKGLEEQRFTFYNEDGECLAIYQQHPTKSGLIKPEKMLWTSEA
ncbi:tRNA pseudouridine(55) synthase TruB [Halalkalibacter urbisdiaboli]|uniref:tRNA pseudouridine(55) synthase TruB n=1 Tax=Halalkalibacter urbisdiaboli TaxID=1960589 RepID=UPI000B4524D1|nr:tRNA pseudouridine(55) synthase TruB [Halalkalibacter urbisdiaboli]